MITISEEAMAIIEEKQQPLYLDVPKKVEGCCFDLNACPTVRFGKPRKMSEYTAKIIQDVTVYVPPCFPGVPLEIRVTHFLGFRWLSLAGWRLA